jgi:AraC-like DNA-binding protein
MQSLKTRYVTASMREIDKPVHFKNAHRPENTLVQINKGSFKAGSDHKKIKEGSFYFVPATYSYDVIIGEGTPTAVIGHGQLPEEDEFSKYLKPISCFADTSQKTNVHSVVRFDAMLYDAVCFFYVLGIQPFEIPYDEELAFLVKQICIEQELHNIGRFLLIDNYIQEIIIQIFRFIDSKPEFRQNIQKVEYLLDKRLVDVVAFIYENLGGDLSNKAIADVAYVSEDYVGQFFKSITNRNLQEYVEEQRLHKAVSMLHTTALSVQEISHKVGFKDPAYFSRRFKLKFGENANAMRKEPA